MKASKLLKSVNNKKSTKSVYKKVLAFCQSLEIDIHKESLITGVCREYTDDEKTLCELCGLLSRYHLIHSSIRRDVNELLDMIYTVKGYLFMGISEQFKENN